MTHLHRRRGHALLREAPGLLAAVRLAELGGALPLRGLGRHVEVVGLARRGVGVLLPPARTRARIGPRRRRRSRLAGGGRAEGPVALNRGGGTAARALLEVPAQERPRRRRGAQRRLRAPRRLPGASDPPRRRPLSAASPGRC